MRLGLRARVALTFGILSLIVAVIISATTYGVARVYLLSQRETAALTRALVDARAAGASLSTGTAPARVLDQIPSVGTSQPMLRIGQQWYTSGVTVSPESLPASLLDLSSNAGGASQRFAVGEDPYFAVAIEIPGGVYVEVFPLRDLDRTFVISGWLLTVLSLVAFGLGALVGRYAGARLLRPLRELSDSAQRVAEGDLSVRLQPTGDRDLDPIGESFNEMAEAVEQQLARERRFTANVSHELRSPLTSVLGTAELLERRRDRLPERDAGLVEVLARQVRRLSQTILDLLEISSVTSQPDVQLEVADVAALCRDVLRDRSLDESLILGDTPLVRTDARRLERILGNLVDNAQRHGQGLVAIRIEQQPEGTVSIVVDDAGPGIDDEEAARLFEPFARGSSAAGSDGAGLGLALVREQGRVLGAAVRIERSPAGGARFAIELPGER